MGVPYRSRTVQTVLAALALCVLAAAVITPRADAIAFGANLSRPADNMTRCGQFLFPQQSITCSAESTNLTTGESGFPPVGVGVVTQVRVKVGPITGPMQIVVEEALRKDNPSDPGHPTYACCKAINASQVFTPAANAITPVNVNLTTRQDIAPDPASGFYVDDHLSLSVLDPNVPIPVNIDNTQTIGVSLWFPAWKVGDERAGGFGTSGGQVLFNADWNASPGADQSPLEFLKRTFPVRAGNVFAPLLCAAGAPCVGNFLLQNLNARLLRLSGARETGSVLRKRTRRTYAKKKFKIKAGKRKTLKIPLNRKGKRLLRGRKKVKVVGEREAEERGRRRPALGPGQAARSRSARPAPQA